MSERTPYPKYRECPCGSGQKYKFCCFTKGFHYYVDDEDSVSRSIPLTKDLSELLKQHRANMEAKLGRPVRPDERLFPELAAMSEEELTQKMVEDFQKLGIRPEMIYAFKKTGRMVTELNKHLIPDIELAEWDAAVNEYYELHPEEDPATT